MTYGLYAREWHLTNTVTAGNFAIDPLAVVVMLVGFGGISDQIGHRATMLAGLFASLVGALLFAVAPNVCWVFAGRALMGIGVGLAASPSTAAILEFTSRNKSAASVTMGAEVMGFTAALLISWIARSESVISAAFRCRRAAVAVLAIWHRTLGTVSISSIHSKPAEAFYWITILFRRRSAPRSATGWPIQPALATPAARVFASGLALIVGAYGWTNVSRTVRFWIAFVLTRPIGATLGDFLDKPFDNGGLALSRYTASAALAATMVLLIVLLPQCAEQHSA
jgi:MFS family permease